MIHRRMRIDFSDVSLRWSKNDDFSTIINSFSPIASAFEPYLNKVMTKVLARLPEDEETVRQDIWLFIAQEGSHYRVHGEFNKQLYARYPKLKEFEAAVAGDLKLNLANNSLKYNLAYCVGFENLATYMAKFTFEELLPYYEDADGRVSTLFLWHNAEEFEHRSACSDAYKALTKDYLTRIRGFVYFMKHLLGYNKKMLEYMFEIDRMSMTPERRAESIQFEKDYNRRYISYVKPRMWKIFLPFYDPGKQTAPKDLFKALDYYGEVAARPVPLGPAA
jgi:predicted metal-dependent hydrolase